MNIVVFAFNAAQLSLSTSYPHIFLSIHTIMVQFFTEIPKALMPWIREQKMFWVATAPLSESGHVNVSPKGYNGTFHIEDETTVWYEDMTGSGIETLAHVRENGRLTIMFCAFEGPPRIMRLFGYGQVFEFDTPEYNSFIPLDKRQPGSRSVISLKIHKVSTSCGYSIPFYTFKSNRARLHAGMARKEGEDIKAESSIDAYFKSNPTSEPDSQAKDGEALPPLPDKGLKWYWKNKNIKSIDGLPGLQTAYTSRKTFDSAITTKDWGKDDESVSGGSQMIEKPMFINWVDTKIAVGFILGVFASGLWVNLVNAVGPKIKTW